MKIIFINFCIVIELPSISLDLVVISLVYHLARTFFVSDLRNLLQPPMGSHRKLPGSQLQLGKDVFFVGVHLHFRGVAILWERF